MELRMKMTFKSWYIIIKYTKISKEIILNRDLCGLFFGTTRKEDI